MKQQAIKIPELLAPAGDMDKLKVAVRYGADAVYLGDSRFSLRTRAGNFDPDELRQAVRYAHEHGVRAYVTVNIFAHEEDFAPLDAYLVFLQSIGIDAIIVADPGVFSRARSVTPGLAVHVSTQANTTNLQSALFWSRQGASRVNLARELSLEKIRSLCRGLGGHKGHLETEVFVHGALCISYSGRCLLSLAMTGRNANRGDCAHPCRYRYHLVEEKRPGEYFPVEEDARGTFIMNSRDLCLMERLPELVSAGVDSLKIEGRMKSVYYLATVVRAYRVALDLCATTKKATGLLPEKLPTAFTDELARAGVRGYGQGFAGAVDRPGREEMLYDPDAVRQMWGPAGIVRQGGQQPVVELRQPLRQGDSIQYMVPGELTNHELAVTDLYDADGTRQAIGRPGEMVTLQTDPGPVAWQEMTLLRKGRC